MNTSYDAVLLIGFGSPEKPEEIPAFLQRLAEGHPIPQKRLDKIAQNYRDIGGTSLYNELTRRQAAALKDSLRGMGLELPVFVGMRNWTPFLKDVFPEMKALGVRRAIAIVLAPHRSSASFGRYTAAAEQAKKETGYESLSLDYAGPWHVHPLFISAITERIRQEISKSEIHDLSETEFIFTAHSIPVCMAEESNYAEEVRETATAVMEKIGPFSWSVAYQSRSGNPRDPWLEPDINDWIRVRAQVSRRVVVVPVGFLSDHTEVLYDLDIAARQTAKECGAAFLRVPTVMDHPHFISMLAQLVEEKSRAKQIS